MRIGVRRGRPVLTVAGIPVGIHGQISGEALRGLWGSLAGIRTRAHLPPLDNLPSWQNFK